MSSIIKQWQQRTPDRGLLLPVSAREHPDHIDLIQLNYNPKAFLGGPGCCHPGHLRHLGRRGRPVFFEGAWSLKQNADVKAYYDKLAAFVGGPANVDFWGALIYRAQLEFFQQAIEKAATLDQTKIAEVMRTAHFKTVMSDDTFLTNQILDVSCYAGQIGQWQNGVPAGHRPGRQAHGKPPIYPKQPWPAPQASTREHMQSTTDRVLNPS